MQPWIRICCAGMPHGPCGIGRLVICGKSVTTMLSCYKLTGPETHFDTLRGSQAKQQFLQVIMHHHIPFAAPL